MKTRREWLLGIVCAPLAALAGPVKAAAFPRVWKSSPPLVLGKTYTSGFYSMGYEKHWKALTEGTSLCLSHKK